MASFDLYVIGFFQSFITLFVVLDPVGNVPFYQSLTKNMDRPQKRVVAKNSSLIAVSILLIFAFTGFAILEFLRITIFHFMIAGGILLLVISVRDILSSEPMGVKANIKPEHVSAFPLGTSLLAGPGSITTVTLIVRFDYGFIIAPIVIIINCIIAYTAFRLSDKLIRFMGSAGMNVLAKMMDILMTAIAISFITTGILQIFNGNNV